MPNSPTPSTAPKTNWQSFMPHHFFHWYSQVPLPLPQLHAERRVGTRRQLRNSLMGCPHSCFRILHIRTFAVRVGGLIFFFQKPVCHDFSLFTPLSLTSNFMMMATYKKKMGHLDILEKWARTECWKPELSRVNLATHVRSVPLFIFAAVHVVVVCVEEATGRQQQISIWRWSSN